MLSLLFFLCVLFFLPAPTTPLDALARLRGGVLPCLNECSNKLEEEDREFGKVRGECVAGVCRCNIPFYGDDCSMGYAHNNVGDKRASTTDPRNPITCLPGTCSENCAFGGVCVSEDTCECRDHWGKASSKGIYPISMPPSNQARPPQQPIIAGDRSALVDALGSLGAPTGTGDPCLGRWPGVQCDLSGYVTGIEFARASVRTPLAKSLQGTLPPSLAKLMYLRDIVVNDNEIVGTIPSEIGQLRRLENLFICTCHKLTRLSCFKLTLSSVALSPTRSVDHLCIIMYSTRTSAHVPVCGLCTPACRESAPLPMIFRKLLHRPPPPGVLPPASPRTHARTHTHTLIEA